MNRFDLLLLFEPFNGRVSSKMQISKNIISVSLFVLSLKFAVKSNIS
jgi:hypothetical protein